MLLNSIISATSLAGISSKCLIFDGVESQYSYENVFIKKVYGTCAKQTFGPMRVRLYDIIFNQ